MEANMMRSEDLKEFTKALLAVQKALKPVKKNAENPHYRSKYADFEAVWNAAKDPLQANGFAVMQVPHYSGGVFILRTTLMHTSGQFVSGDYLLKPQKEDPQGYGSCLSYSKRYALAAMIGLVSEGEDDDGNAASQGHQAPAKASNGAPKPSQAPSTALSGASASSGNTITEGQGKRLYAIWKGAKYEDKEVQAWLNTKYGFNSTREITRDVYQEICETLEKGEPLGAVEEVGF